MEKTQKSSDENHSSPVSTGALLALTFLDTTWRLAIPSIGLTLLGVYFDERLKTTPLLMLIGILVGCSLAIYLVYIQIKRVNK